MNIWIVIRRKQWLKEKSDYRVVELFSRLFFLFFLQVVSLLFCLPQHNFFLGIFLHEDKVAYRNSFCIFLLLLLRLCNIMFVFLVSLSLYILSLYYLDVFFPKRTLSKIFSGKLYWYVKCQSCKMKQKSCSPSFFPTDFIFLPHLFIQMYRVLIAHNSDFPYVKCNYIWHIVWAWNVHSNGKQCL